MTINEEKILREIVHNELINLINENAIDEGWVKALRQTINNKLFKKALNKRAPKLLISREYSKWLKYIKGNNLKIGNYILTGKECKVGEDVSKFLKSVKNKKVYHKMQDVLKVVDGDDVQKSMKKIEDIAVKLKNNPKDKKLLSDLNIAKKEFTELLAEKGIKGKVDIKDIAKAAKENAKLATTINLAISFIIGSAIAIYSGVKVIPLKKHVDDAVETPLPSGVALPTNYGDKNGKFYNSSKYQSLNQSGSSLKPGMAFYNYGKNEKW